MAPRHDWEYWRHKYVIGDDTVTLIYLSQLPNAPALGSLKNKASSEDWAGQRKAFRYQTMTKVTEQIEDHESTKQAVIETQRLVDAAELITRHIRISKAMQRKLLERIQTLKPEDLTPGAVAQWLKISTDIERLALGLATEHTQVDLSNLSDDELERIARGKD